MAYGAEVFNSSGTKILELSSRVARLAAQGQATTTNNGSSNTVTVSITGMLNNDSWEVVAFSGSIAGVKVSKNTGSFTITTPSSNTVVDYLVVRT